MNTQRASDYRADLDFLPPRTYAALKGWARRRLNGYLRAVDKYLGYTPTSVTIFAEDFHLLDGKDDRITLVCGPRKPVPADQRTPIH